MSQFKCIGWREKKKTGKYITSLKIIKYRTEYTHFIPSFSSSYLAVGGKIRLTDTLREEKSERKRERERIVRERRQLE